jgi:hypothetical protein
MEEAFAFAGSNAWRCEQIVSVKRLISTIMQECDQAEHIVPEDVLRGGCLREQTEVS